MNHGESCQTVRREHVRAHFTLGVDTDARIQRGWRGGGWSVGGWGWAVGGRGVTQVHNKYVAELERVQDGEQKRRLGGEKKTRKCEGSVKQNEGEKGGCYN